MLSASYGIAEILNGSFSIKNDVSRIQSLQVRSPSEERHAGDLVRLVPRIRNAVPEEAEPHPPPVPLQQPLAVAAHGARKAGGQLHSVQDVGNVGRLEV